MGCDIHILVERYHDDDGWQPVYIPPDPMNDNDEKERLEVDAFDKFGWYHGGRNYSLFAILANVRNSYWAGWTPISEPKGVPDDISHEVREWLNYWSGDLHSHTHFYAQELNRIDWWAPGREVVSLVYDKPNLEHLRYVNILKYQLYKKYADKGGVISLVEEQIREKGQPDEWLVRDFEYIPIGTVFENLDGRILKFNRTDQISFQVVNEQAVAKAVKWSQSYASGVGEGWFEFLARLNFDGGQLTRTIIAFDN